MSDDFAQLAGLIIMGASFLLSLTAMVVAWLRTRRRDLDERIGALGQRVDTLERSMHGVPGREDVHSLKLGLSELAGEIRVVGAQLSGQRDILGRLEAVVTRHEDHLLETRR